MGGRILIVEDTKLLADAIADTLRMEGYDVSISLNGRDALDALENTQPDLVITDLVMPKMDGLEFTRRLRGHPRHGAIPVIIISAQVSEEIRLAGEQAGANLFIRKPFDHNQLIDAILTLLK
jgi:CheY-like chemotaxis protein